VHIGLLVSATGYKEPDRKDLMSINVAWPESFPGSAIQRPAENGWVDLEQSQPIPDDLN
jgi:hypothetical protein